MSAELSACIVCVFTRAHRSLRRLHDSVGRRSLSLRDGVPEAQADDAEVDAVPGGLIARLVPAAERARAGGGRGRLRRELDRQPGRASALPFEGRRAAALLLCR